MAILLFCPWICLGFISKVASRAHSGGRLEAALPILMSTSAFSAPASPFKSIRKIRLAEILPLDPD